MLKELFNRKRYLYPELKPKSRFIKTLETHVLPEMEKEGFKLLKSGPSLKKKVDSFEWIVDFNASKWNSGNIVCIYNPYYTVKNVSYRKFLKDNPSLVHTYGEPGHVGTTYGKQHWDKNIFSLDDKKAYFLEDNDFAKYDNYELVDQMLKNIREVGMPYFQMMSQFVGIKKFHIPLELRADAPKLFDLSYVLDKKEEAKNILDWYYSSNSDCADWVELEMQKRKEYWLQQRV